MMAYPILLGPNYFLFRAIFHFLLKLKSQDDDHPYNYSNALLMNVLENQQPFHLFQLYEIQKYDFHDGMPASVDDAVDEADAPARFGHDLLCTR